MTTTRVRAFLESRAGERREGGEDSGFSLIELIVVVLIIGTIAAIAVPVYQGVQASAIDKSIRSDLRHSAMQLEEYKQRHGSYPHWNSVGQYITISKDNYDYMENNFLYCTNSDEYGIFVVGLDRDRYQQTSTYGFRQDNSVPSSNRQACPAMGITENQRSIWLKGEGEWVQ